MESWAPKFTWARLAHVSCHLRCSIAASWRWTTRQHWLPCMMELCWQGPQMRTHRGASRRSWRLSWQIAGNRSWVVASQGFLFVLWLMLIAHRERLEVTLSVFLMILVGSLWLAKNLSIPQARHNFSGFASFDAAYASPFSPVHVPIPSNSAILQQQLRQDDELLQCACLNEWKVILQGFHFCNSSQPLSRIDESGMETDLSFRDLQPLAPQGAFTKLGKQKRIFCLRVAGLHGIPRIHTCWYFLGVSWGWSCGAAIDWLV